MSRALAVARVVWFRMVGPAALAEGEYRMTQFASVALVGVVMGLVSWLIYREPEVMTSGFILTFMALNRDDAAPTARELCALAVGVFLFVLGGLNGAVIGAVGAWVSAYYWLAFAWSRMPLSRPMSRFEERTPGWILVGSGLGGLLGMASPWAPTAMCIGVAAVALVGDRLVSATVVR